MGKNVTLKDDIFSSLKGTVEYPEVIATFLLNYLKTLTFNSDISTTQLEVNGKKFTLEVQREKNGAHGYVSFELKGKVIRLYFGSKKELVDTIVMVRNEFLGGDAKGSLEVKGRVVVDIGAYVADTAIFFVLEGARHVYAIEPFPYFYEIGRKNIAASRMESKITMVNAGVGGKSAEISVDSSKRSFSGSGFGGSGAKKQIQIMSLEEIVRKYRLKNAALKIDCEGYEYEILLNSDPNTLRKFDRMEIEYHYGYLNILKKLKEAGFKVTYKGTTKRYNFGSKSWMVYGFMQAKRIDK